MHLAACFPVPDPVANVVIDKRPLLLGPTPLTASGACPRGRRIELYRGGASTVRPWWQLAGATEDE